MLNITEDVQTLLSTRKSLTRRSKKMLMGKPDDSFQVGSVMIEIEQSPEMGVKALADAIEECQLTPDQLARLMLGIHKACVEPLREDIESQEKSLSKVYGDIAKALEALADYDY